MEGLDKQVKKRKYIEIAALVALTVFFLVVFKESKKGLFSIEYETSAFLSKYTNGLMPLNKKSLLSKEDIVNFALYGNIPIDRKNEKVLIINSDSLGDKRFIIAKIKIDSSTNNYNKLIAKLDLDDVQKSNFDTLLAAYRNKLYKSILLNEKESFAINSNVAQLQKDLNEKINLLLTENSQKRNLTLAKAVEEGIKDVNELKSTKNFIFVNPDTVLNLVAKSDKPIKTKINHQKKLLNNLSFSIDTEKEDKVNMGFVMNDEFISVNIPPPPPPPGSSKNLQNHKKEKMDKFFDEQNFQFNFDEKENEFGFKFNIENIPPDVFDNLNKVDKDLAKKLKGLKIKIDSQGVFIKIKSDSIKSKTQTGRK
jgi:hypothetical protein